VIQSTQLLQEFTNETIDSSITGSDFCDFNRGDGIRQMWRSRLRRYWRLQC